MLAFIIFHHGISPRWTCETNQGMPLYTRTSVVVYSYQTQVPSPVGPNCPVRREPIGLRGQIFRQPELVPWLQPHTTMYSISMFKPIHL